MSDFLWFVYYGCLSVFLRFIVFTAAFFVNFLWGRCFRWWFGHNGCLSVFLGSIIFAIAFFVNLLWRLSFELLIFIIHTINISYWHIYWLFLFIFHFENNFRMTLFQSSMKFQFRWRWRWHRWLLFLYYKFRYILFLIYLLIFKNSLSFEILYFKSSTRLIMGGELTWLSF